MDTPTGTSPVILLSIMGVWVLLSLYMGAKKAYFDTYDNLSEEEVEKAHS
ncbi:MAG: hypothetical protein IAF58_01245 [Leptolyngbya sp.]|nr:hypothetical protein [Candidatus Melainabacteria bacterium]